MLAIAWFSRVVTTKPQEPEQSRQEQKAEEEEEEEEEEKEKEKEEEEEGEEEEEKQHFYHPTAATSPFPLPSFGITSTCHQVTSMSSTVGLL